MKKVSCIALILALGAYARFDDIAELEATNFGKTILSTVAVQLSVTEGRVDEIVDSLNKIKEKIVKDQEAHDGRHIKDQADFDSQINALTKIIDDAQKNYDDAVNAIAEFTPKRDQAEKDLDDEQKNLKQLKKDRDDEIEDRRIKYEAHLKRQEDYKKSIDSTDKALGLLSNLNNFLQMPVLVEIVKDLPTMRSVSPSHAALLRVLVQLSTSKHANPETVKKALGLIAKLKSSLETSKQTDLDDDIRAKQLHDELIDQYDISIRNSSTRVTDLETQYADYKRIVQENIKKRDDNQKTVEDNTKLRDDVKKQKKVEQDNYDSETARR
jgi:tetratricopeptide (TPR) repeat protein